MKSDMPWSSDGASFSRTDLNGTYTIFFSLTFTNIILARPASNSSYASAQAYQQSTSTPSTTDNNIDSGADNNGGHTPYFTPSHTPSHHSVGTTEEDVGEGRAPDSPLPYSNYHPYNAQYGRRIVEGFEERFRE